MDQAAPQFKSRLKLIKAFPRVEHIVGRLEKYARKRTSAVHIFQLKESCGLLLKTRR